MIGLAQSARLPLFIGIAGGVIAGLCSVAQAYLLSTIVDQVFLGHSNLAGVWPWMRLLLGVIACRGVLLWLQEIAASEVAIGVKQALRSRLFAHILRLGPSFSRGQKTGELSGTAVDGIEALDAYYSQYLPQLTIGALVPLTILILVLPLDLLSGLILLLTAPLIPFFMFMIGRTAEQATSRQYATLGRLSSHMLDSIQGLATLKIFGQAASQVTNIRRVADKFRELTLQVLQVSFLSALALELIATISTAMIAVEVGLRLLYGQMAFQEALFLLILAPEFYAPLRMLGARFHAGMTGTAAASRIFEVLDTPLPSRLKVRQTPTQVGAPAAQGNAPVPISFRDVSFVYPGRDHPALDRIDLDIPAGLHMAIVGASGAGKTTLAALILGFIQPTAGELWIGNSPRGDATSEPGRCRIGWVPQAPHLFHESIAANIRLGKPDASEDDVQQAARLAHLDEFVESLPSGLETVVGEGGARLSSGESQRLSLARAFLLDAPILVLDEPSASLDPETEARLDESLQRLAAGRTVITIAHRLNTVERAGAIIVLEQGKIVERGQHAELLAAGGSYSRLIEASRGTVPAPSPAAVPAPAGIPGSLQAEAGRSWHTREPPVPTGAGQGILGHLLGFLEGSWKSVALSVLLATLTIGSSVALMGTSAWLISAAALQPSIAALQVAIVGVRLFGIARAVFRYFERLVSHSVTFRLLLNIRVWFYSRLEPLAPARLMDYRAGDLVNRAVADVETLENLYVRVLSPVMTAVALGAVVTAFLWALGAVQIAALLATAFVLAGLVVPLVSMRASRQPGSRMIAHRSLLRSQMVDWIQGLADLVAFGRVAGRAAALRQTSEEYAAAQRAMARIGGLQAGISSVVINLAMWSALMMWIPLVAEGTGSGLLLAPLALIVLSSFEAVAGLPLAGQLWPATAAAARRLLEIVSVEPAVAEAPATANAALTAYLAAEPSTPLLEFQRVTFQYPGRSRPALRDITFSLRRGDCVAVVGPSGSGKSTLAQLALRFWEFGAGEILLGGQSPRSMSPDDVRAQIGYASLNPYLFDTSIFENLRLASRGLRQSDLERAARHAAIHDFIQSLPGKYDTLIGEHGSSLSAGERQRLGLARVMLKDAPILLLDEPTANLDARNEALILDSLFHFAVGRACLFITHRLHRMEHFDQILVMDHGAIRERGSHSNLMAAGGLYARLWALQNSEAELLSGRLASSS